MSWIDDLFDEIDGTTPVEDWQVNLIDRLITTSNLSHEEREQIEQKMLNLTREEAKDITRYLFENQLNPVTHGNGYYSKTELQEFIKTIMK